MMGNDKKRALTQSELVDAVNSLKAATTINELLLRASETLGVIYSVYIHFPAIGAVDFNNTGVFHHYKVPDEIVNFYNSTAKSHGDPVCIAAFAKGSPFWLSDSFSEPYIIKLGYEKVIQRALELLKDGLCCPLFGPDGRKGYSFISFDRDKDEFDPIMPLQIQAITQIMHIQYCLLLKGLQKQINLTPRESEVLELMSYGKSNPEIAQILKISPRTVAVHAAKIFVKLGVGDRVSAALRAQTILVKL